MIDTKTAIEKITNGEFDNLFTDIYIDSSMIDYQKKRYVHAIEQYETIFCPDKVAIFSAPGRSEVCGNHTDHQHGMVLATSINLDTIAVSAKNNNDVVRFVSDGYDMITLNIIMMRQAQRSASSEAFFVDLRIMDTKLVDSMLMQQVMYLLVQDFHRQQLLR